MKRFDFYFGIASYNRKDRQPMLRLLNSFGYPKEQILLAVQCEQDFKEYEPIYGDMATIIYQEGKNISDNKNAILDYIVEHLENQRVVILSDKVRAINWIGRSRKTHTVETKAQMDKLVRTAFELTRQIGGRVWGCYTLDNTFFMKNTSVRSVICNPVLSGIDAPCEIEFFLCHKFDNSSGCMFAHAFI